MKSPLTLAVLLASSPFAASQGAASVLEPTAHQWLDENSRLEYPADLDGDGKPELVGWWSYWSTHSSVQVFFWTRDEQSNTWSEKEDTFGSGNAAYSWETATAIGDFDADGKDEVAVCHHWGIEVFEPDAMGVPVRIVDQDYLPNISAVDRQCTVADFDEDGRDDIALVAGPTLYLFRSIPGGFDLVDSYTIPGSLVRLKVRSADAAWTDTELEIVVLQDLPVVKLRVFGVDATNSLREVPAYDLFPGAGASAGDAVMLADGDVDGDGDIDMVAFGAGGSYQVLRREGPGYTIEAPRVGGPATNLADIDGDGDLDGICCGSGGGSFQHNTAPATFEICLGDGTGNFDSSVQFAGLGAEHVAGALDFDGDGDMDVLAGRVVLLGKSALTGELCDGAVNSTGGPAVLSASGSHSMSSGGPTFSATGLPTGHVAMLISAAILDSGDVNAAPFFDGTLCLSPFLGRLKIANADGQGNAYFGGAADWNWVPWNTGSAPNNKFGYQVWYRDPQAGGSGANLSSAVHALLVQ